MVLSGINRKFYAWVHAMPNILYAWYMHMQCLTLPW